MLLAITLNTCARSGADGETYLAAAESLGRENWNEPRLFKDAAEYCRTRALCCPPEQTEAYFEKALSVCYDFQRIFPLDERGYMKEATVLLDKTAPQTPKTSCAASFLRKSPQTAARSP